MEFIITADPVRGSVPDLRRSKTALFTLGADSGRQILVSSTPHDPPRVQRLLGEAGRLGFSLGYAEKATPSVWRMLLIGELFPYLSPWRRLFLGHPCVTRGQRSEITILAWQIHGARR